VVGVLATAAASMRADAELHAVVAGFNDHGLGLVKLVMPLS
jgi:hypothetical protein